jgi:LmbE family N-acetylglucosaminyl deacetylase
MATLVCFHAHPDDEAIATGGTMAMAAHAGHRVVLVLATRGEQGEPVEGVLEPGEALWERRVTETHRSAEILGVARVEFLGYEDSGMVDEPSNENPECFWMADLGEAAARLAEILREEDADLLTIYDPHGGYGHPDHIQVHRVGAKAASLSGTRVLWSTMNRTRLLEHLVAEAEMGDDAGDLAERREMIDDDRFGMAESHLTHSIDVAPVLAKKREAMAAHASQIAPDAFFFAMPDEAFVGAFGTEWFVDPTWSRPAGADFLTSIF